MKKLWYLRDEISVQQSTIDAESCKLIMKSFTKISILILIVVGVLLFQSLISISSIKLNLTLILVYYFGIKKGEVYGAGMGTAIGFLEDTISGQILGPCILSKGVVGVLSAYVSRGFFVWTPILGVFSVFVLTFVDEFVVYLSLSLFSQSPSLFQDFITLGAIKALINAPFGILIKPER